MTVFCAICDREVDPADAVPTGHTGPGDICLDCAGTPL